MFYPMTGSDSNTINLQATLSSMSADSELRPIHHPVTCNGRLWFEEDNSFHCEHGSVDQDDDRTRSCINHTIAILLIEILCEREAGKR